MILPLLACVLCFLYLLRVWFVEYLHGFLYFTCGFVDIFFKILFTINIISHIIKSQTTRNNIKAITIQQQTT